MTLQEFRRQNLLQGRDPDLSETDKRLGVGLSDTEIMNHNMQATEMFKAANPWFHACPENAALIMNYLKRNEFALPNSLITSELLERTAWRMRRMGLLKERPEESVPQVERTTGNQTPETFRGWDSQTGQERDFTVYEVDRMSSDQFARTFRLNRSGMVLAGRR